MNKDKDKTYWGVRRGEMSFFVAIVIGLVIGILIKRARVGLMAGLVIGLVIVFTNTLRRRR